jgi:predicted anti-sigma-YlaC factor YlaD
LRPIKFAPLLLLLNFACIRHYALTQVAGALSSSGEGGAFARDDDPALVHESLAFALKSMESLADQLPDDAGLRLAMASGFTQYAYAFVQTPAELQANPDLQQIARARKLYLRARQYGLDGLKIKRGITEDQLRSGKERDAALAKLEKEDVALVYWTLVPWAAAIAANKRDLALVGDLPAIAAMLDRALVLDEAFDHGTLHELSITFDPSRPQGTTPEKQKAHFDRVMALSNGMKISPLITYAQGVAAPAQDKKQYLALLKQAASFDVDKPEARNGRLANVLSQRRAQYLLDHVDDVFSD